MNQIEAQKNEEYTEYIKEHIQNVQEAWGKLQIICPNEIFVTDQNLNKSITERTIQHDSSKYNADEFTAYRRFFYPISKDEKKKSYNDFQKAWILHYTRNDHHWEHWISPNSHDFNNQNFNIQDVKNTFILDRGDKRIETLVEMICDWMAMGKVFGNTAKQYYDSNKEKIRLLPNDREFVEAILNKVG